MVFNSDKFECLRFWPGKTPKPQSGYMSPDGTPIEEKDHLRDLGVQIETDLTFSPHPEHCCCCQQVDWLGYENFAKNVKTGHDDYLEVTGADKA